MPTFALGDLTPFRGHPPSVYQPHLHPEPPLPHPESCQTWQRFTQLEQPHSLPHALCCLPRSWHAWRLLPP